MKKIIIGNWKMNPATVIDAKKIATKTKKIASELSNTEVVICPPFTFISLCAPKTKTNNFSVGAQSVSRDESGSHTGEVSAAMLKSLGVSHVIVGHSEERERGETNEIITKKIFNLLGQGIKPIICFGEKVRDQETGSHFDFIKEEMKTVLSSIPKNRAEDLVIAYEPVWAIGAKEAMVPSQICEMIIFIRKIYADIFDQKTAMKVPVLYGGSVNASNAGDIITIGQVNGLLVGRESVNVAGFVELLKVVDQVV